MIPNHTNPYIYDIYSCFHLRRCSHGTPSRIPLIKQQKSQHSNSHQQNNIRQSPIEYPPNGVTVTSVQSIATNNHDCDDINQLSPATNNPQVPITIILIILITYICIGTVIFSLWENWSIVDGAYFCFVTLSTIGFGDLVPKNTFHGPELQLFACCAYLLLGLVLVAMSFSLLETQLLWKCRRMAVRLKLAKDWWMWMIGQFVLLWFVLFRRIIHFIIKNKR